MKMVKMKDIEEYLKQHPCTHRVFKDGSDGMGGIISDIPCCSLRKYGNVNCLNLMAAGKCPVKHDGVGRERRITEEEKSRR